jgi:predicted nucleic acid-binding protein
MHRVLSRITVVPVSRELGRHAGELLGATGLPGSRCAIDAIVAATALERERPVVLLTSDPDDLSRLVEEPERPKAQRIRVVQV